MWTSTSELFRDLGTAALVSAQTWTRPPRDTRDRVERAADRDTPKIEGRLKFLTGPDVEILFGRPFFIFVVGDGVGLVVRVGDAADVAEARGPARAVAVPARSIAVARLGPNGLKFEK